VEDAREAADAAKDLVGGLGAGFMFAAETRERGREVGLRSKPLYHLGRGGVLGDVPVEVVVAAFAFFPPEVVREHWATGRSVMSPPDGGRFYAECAAEHGRRVHGGLDGAARLVELLEKLVDSAAVEGLPLFAAWRAVPRPDDAPGRLGLLLHVAREHRGATHVAACAATSLSGLQAVMAGPYGAGNARFFDWPEPYPDPTPYRPRWDVAEELTAAATAEAWLSLAPAERGELVELLGAAKAVAG
jgi:hypothetical protein